MLCTGTNRDKGNNKINLHMEAKVGAFANVHQMFGIRVRGVVFILGPVSSVYFFFVFEKTLVSLEQFFVRYSFLSYQMKCIFTQFNFQYCKIELLRQVKFSRDGTVFLFKKKDTIFCQLYNFISQFTKIIPSSYRDYAHEPFSTL